MKLKEKECSRCPQCNNVYFDNLGAKTETCTSCKVPNEREPYFTRLRLERFAFVYTLSLIFSIAMLVGVNWETNKAGPGFVSVLFLVVFPGLLMGIYHMVNTYLSGTGSASENTRKELSIFREIYFSNNKPTAEEISFSWPRYFREAVHFIGILIIFVILGAGITIAGKLLN